MNRLEEWLEGYPRFRQETLGRRIQFFEKTTRRTESVRALGSSWAPEAMVESGGVVYGWFERRNGQHRTAVVSPEAALELYRAGTTLYILGPRFLKPFCEEVADALRIPRKLVECGVFCNQPGAVSRMHFDKACTLTVQILGSKRWTLAPNVHAPEPLTSWATLDPVSPALQMYAREPLPTSMPNDAQSFFLEPGAMLYVPRGSWHQTISEEESVSLHIHLLSHSWMDAALTTLRARLSRDQSWRRNAYPLWDPDYADRGDAAAILASLREAVNDLDVADFVRASSTVSMTDRIKSRARSAFTVEGEIDGACSQVTFTAEEHGVENVTNIEMSSEYVSATRLLERSREGISAEELATRVPLLGRDNALGLVQMLVDIGYARLA